MKIIRIIQTMAIILLIIACSKENDFRYLESENYGVQQAEKLTRARAKSSCSSSLIFNGSPVTSSVPFVAYDNAFVFENKIYVSEDLGEWWQSKEGANWKKVTIPKRAVHREGFLFAFKNSLWYVESANKIWKWGKGSKYSFGMPAWHLVSAKANYPYSRGALESGYVVFKNRIWRFVGDQEIPNGIVAYSFDMVKWKKKTGGRLFPRRRYATYTVFDGKIWMIGGEKLLSSDQGHSWFTEDGMNWYPATTGKKWNRQMHSTSVYDNKLWIIGGQVGERNGKCDVWYSRDGLSWVELTQTNNAPFSPRIDHSSVAFKNKLWVIGGYDYTDRASVISRREVWNMQKCTDRSFGPSLMD